MLIKTDKDGIRRLAMMIQKGICKDGKCNCGECPFYYVGEVYCCDAFAYEYPEEAIKLAGYEIREGAKNA